MPGVFHEPIHRKAFLRTAACIGGSFFAATSAKADTGPGHGKVRIALLSDTHIPQDATNEYRSFRPVENLRKLIPQVVSSKPDVAIINGDAARLTGEIEDYKALRSLITPLAKECPIHIGLGNHDDRKNFFEVFPSDRTGLLAQKHVSLIAFDNLRVVVLDSLLYVDKVAGLLGKAQRTFIAEFLEQAEPAPTVFLVHHSLGDGDGDLLDFERLFRILQPHRHVKAIFYGHSHRYHIEKREHIHLINLPAVGYNFDDSQPVGWVDATFTSAGVDLKLHAIGGNVTGNGQTKQVQWA